MSGTDTLPESIGKLSKKQNNLPEYCVLILFIALYTVVTIFHEPWFDEAQAWQIAKYASLKDIFFKLPHTEGHPPLWHLLLRIPAKLGVPYEIGLKVTAAIPTFLTVFLILFKSPFPKIVRFVLPFNYFIFYQYGVVSRPYGLLIVAMILLAMYFDTRDTHPWRYICLLIFLCLTSAYGFIIAGGISMAWVIDILKRHGSLKESLRDKCVLPLAALLAFAALLALQLMPMKQTYAVNTKSEGNIISLILYSAIGILSDSLLTSAITDIARINDIIISPVQIISAAIVGLFILVAMIVIISKGKKKYFFFPYVLLSLFSFFVYLYTHHIGIMAVLILFSIWISYEEMTECIPRLMSKIETSAEDRNLLKTAGKIAIALILLVPMMWTAVAAFNEIRVPYIYARETARFLKENNLSELAIFCPPSKSLRINENSDDEDNLYYNVNEIGNSVELTAYFDSNIISNLNCGDQMPYYSHIVPSYEESLAIIEKWKANGAPDVLIGNMSIREIFGNDDNLPEYVPVYKMKSVGISIWKWFCDDERYLNYNYIYIRSDLLDEYNLEPLEVEDYWKLINWDLAA